MHSSSAEQAVPHEPQCATLESMLTHSASQTVSPAAHVGGTPPEPPAVVSVTVLPPAPPFVDAVLVEAAVPLDPPEPLLLCVVAAALLVAWVSPEPSVVEVVVVPPAPPIPCSESILSNSGATQAPPSSVAATTLPSQALATRGSGRFGFIGAPVSPHGASAMLLPTVQP